MHDDEDECARNTVYILYNCAQILRPSSMFFGGYISVQEQPDYMW